jgi:hypothetical protein
MDHFLDPIRKNKLSNLNKSSSKNIHTDKHMPGIPGKPRSPRRRRHVVFYASEEKE